MRFVSRGSEPHSGLSTAGRISAAREHIGGTLECSLEDGFCNKAILFPQFE